jgi:glutamate/tyrosine decarboxylase-like PLP-dependent enzyme
MPLYRDLLEQLRKAFPPPVSDPVHDGYVVFSILRALDQVDALKTQAPILGSPMTPDFAAAAGAKLADGGRTVEQVLPELVRCLQGMIIWGHPRSQVNVIAHPSIASIIGVVLPSMYNPNLCSEESGFGFSEAEVRVASIIADLVGYPAAAAGGLFTFGGTGTLLYGLKIGQEKASPQTMQQGAKDDVVVLASGHSHYAVTNVAGWLGIGQANVWKAKTRPDNSMDIADLERLAREAIAAGKKIAAIVATMGTTDSFGIDDLAAVHELRERLVVEHQLGYRPHLHADAVIGWAWSVFNDYDIRANPLGFRGRTLRSLAAAVDRIQHLGLSDSLGVDFHKTGFAPYISSLFLVRDRQDFQFLARDRASMPYLYHSGDYHPGMFSLETSRGGSGVMSALASLLLLGKEGYRTLLGHAVDMAEMLREMIGAQPELTTVNSLNSGPVTLFRAYPRGVDTFRVQERELHDSKFRGELRAYNEFNRRIFQRVHAAALAGQGVAIGFTDRYRASDDGEPIVALKSYVLSPFVDESRMQTIIERVQEARAAVEAEGSYTSASGHA